MSSTILQHTDCWKYKKLCQYFLIKYFSIDLPFFVGVDILLWSFFEKNDKVSLS